MIFFFIYFVNIIIAAKLVPLVVLPSVFYWNAHNRIIVTPPGQSPDIVDVHLKIWSDEEIVFQQILSAKLAGSAIQVNFHIAEQILKPWFNVSVALSNDDKFEAIVPGCPDVAKIHLQTDKGVYRAGDTVQVRALSLTNDGNLYRGPIEFKLINPKGFELFRRTNQTEKNFIALNFHLPDSLSYGHWKIVAKAIGSDYAYSNSLIIEVADYEIQPFRLLVTTKETNYTDKFDLIASARYPYGRYVKGRLLVRCDCTDTKFSNRCLLAESDVFHGYKSFICEKE